jgi:hypothetical protein
MCLLPAQIAGPALRSVVVKRELVEFAPSRSLHRPWMQDSTADGTLVRCSRCKKIKKSAHLARTRNFPG